MTQKTLKEQVAEMQNNLTALDKLLSAPIVQAPITEKRVRSFLLSYDDGEEVLFEPKIGKSASEILAIIRERNELLNQTREIEYDPIVRKATPKLGFECVIHGKNYNSINHAGRVLNMCRHTVKSNIDRGLKGWDYK